MPTKFEVGKKLESSINILDGKIIGTVPKSGCNLKVKHKILSFERSSQLNKIDKQGTTS